MSKVLLLTTLLLMAAATSLAGAADKPFPGIRNLMTAEEFKAAGLDQLSPEELRQLDTWLLHYTAGEAAILRQDNTEVREASQDFELVTRISGDFRGWSGETVFRLENGQIWRQRLPGRYHYSGPPNPEVRISRSWMGFYKMTVVETDKSIGVKLVR